MQLTPDEFRRRVGPVLAAYDSCPTPDGFVASEGEATIHISVAEDVPRRLGLFHLPRCRVDISFDGLDADGTARFLDLFDRVFRKGGG